MNKQRLLLWIVSVGAAVIVTGCQAPRTQSQAATGAEAPPGLEAPEVTLHPRVMIETTLGDIVVELNGEKAPGTVLNFVQYVQSKFYEGTIVHRVLKDTMIQGGEYTADMETKLIGLRPGPKGAWQSNLKNERGTIAMIRGRGTTGSASAQFYINIAENPNLDDPQWRGVYTVFGKVVEGMDTVDRIRNTPVGPHPKYAAGRSVVVPVEPVFIESAKLLTPFDQIQAQAILAADQAEQEDRVDKLVKQLEEKAGVKAVTTESGLRYVDFVVGQGMSPLPTSTIEFQYRGTLIDGTEFESTYKAKPAVREIALLIPGLQEGLTTMNEGGQRTIVILPELGFGEGGIPRVIPPDSVLIYEIELLAVQ